MQDKKQKRLPTATIRKDSLSELSGLVASRRYPGIFWAHNDSGDKARLFALRADGRVVAELKVKNAENVDWEDIAVDSGTLYITDLGNNDNRRKDLCVYTLPEPDPRKGDQKVEAQRIPVAYPDQDGFPPLREWRFDCEAAFVYQGKVHILTKHRQPGMRFFPADSTNLYRLDSNLVKLDSRSGLGGWVTAADLSPDRQTLAVLCHLPVASIWLFDLRGVGEKLLSKPTHRLILQGVKQCEALCFADAQNLLVGNEQRDLFLIPRKEIPPWTPSTPSR